MKRQILHSVWILLFGACFAGAGTIEVSSSGPYTTIQAAIEAAVDGDEVVVADGVYTGNGNRDLDFKGKAITVRSENGPGSCTILCQGAENDPHRGFIFQSGEIWSSVVDGFTISGGVADSGGGIECFYGSPIIRNCVISECEAKFYGGGIDLYGSMARVEDCTISGNEAPVGGGVSCDYSLVAIRLCEITGNEATTDVGGGISSYDSWMSVKSCLIAGNSARDFGGGIFLWDVACEISNCTIADNSGADGFGGVYCDRNEAGEPTIVNSILWGNGDDLWNCDGLVTYSCIGNDDAGEGNIHDDPRFTAGATYYLSHIDAGQIVTSPCIDAGSGQADAADIGMNLYTTRSDHSPDVGKVDMGYHRRIGVEPVLQFKLITGAVGNGTIEPELPGPDGGYYNQYAEVKLTAIPSDPNVYRVLQWEEDGTVVLEDPSDPSSVYMGDTYTVLMDSDKRVVVTFEEKGEWTLTVSVSGSGGRLLEPPRGGNYKHRDGDVVTIKVRPNDGYVVQWDGTDRDNTLAHENTVTMTSYREVTVSFRRPVNRYVPSPQYSGIQAAINHAQNGDKVIVSPGVYNPGYGDGYDFGGKAITVVSEYSDDPSATIIDCGGYSRAFIFKNGEGHESIVEGFTIINGFSGQKWPDEKPDKDVGKGWSHDDAPQGEGTAPYGNDEYMPHGLWNLLSIPPILIDMNAGQNGMDGKGGAIACFRHPDKGPSSPVIANCIFKDCIALGGIGVDANSHDPLPEPDEPLDQPKKLEWAADFGMEQQAPEGVDGLDGYDGGGTPEGVAFPGQDGLNGLDGFDGGDGGSAFGGALYFESGSYAKVKKCTILNCRAIGGNAGAGGPGQNGQDGQDGQPGQDGMDGQDGGNGIDAEAGPFEPNVPGGDGGDGGNAGKGGAGGAGGAGGKGGSGGDAGVGGEAFGGGIFFHPNCRVEIEDSKIIGCSTKPGLGNVGSDAGHGGLAGEAGNSGEAGAPGSGGSGGSGAGEGEAGADGKDGLEAVGIATPGLPGSDSYDTDWAFHAEMGTWTQDPNSGYWSVDLSTGVWVPGFGESAWQNSPNYVDDGPWPGIPLQAEALYFYKYRVMDRQGKITNWSVGAYARVGTGESGQPDEVPEAPEEYKGQLGALEWETAPRSAKVDDVNTPFDESLSIWMKAKVPEQEWENRGPFLYQFKWIEWRGGRGGDGGQGGSGRPNGWRSWAGGIYYGANCEVILSDTTIGDNATRTFGVDVWGEPNVFEYNGGDGGDANDGGSGGEAAAGGDGGDGGDGGNAVGFGEAGEGGTGGIGGEGGERNGVKLPDGADGGDGGDGFLVGGNVTTTFGGGSYYDSSYNYENPTMGNFSLVPGFGCEVTQTGCAISGNLSEGSDGGGEYYRYDCTVSLKDCKVIGNSSGNSGGGQYFSGSSLVTINGCDYEDNSAAGSGGGIYCEAELVLDIDDSRFVGNSANGLQGAGGGVYWEGSRTGVAEYNKRFNDRLFDDGFPYVSHSGVSYVSGRGRLFGSNAVTVDKSRFVGNEGKLGGGLCFYDDEDDHNPDSEVTIFDCVANNNRSDYGGGFYWSGGSPTVKACRFNGNIARGGTAVWVDYTSRYGTWAETQAYYWEHWWERENPYFDFAAFGRLGNVYGGGGGIFCWTSDAVIEDCLVNENSSSGSGGGIYVGGGLSYPVLKNCLVTKNSTVLGGGGVASLWETRPTITNCTIVDNFAYSLERDTRGRGGGLLCTSQSETNLINSILWGNTGRNGNQIAIGSDDDPRLLQHPAKLTVSHSDIEGGKPGVFNEFNRELNWDSASIISSDPCFVEPQFFLSQVDAGQTADSPCVDAGSAPASELGLGTYSTRTDSAPEVGQVDIGYHYGVSRLTIVVIGPGMVSVDPNVGGLGTVFTLTAHPDSGYRVKSWKGTDNDPSWNINTNTVTMYRDTTVTVEFELDYNRTIDVFGQYPGVQAAIDDANNGDTIKIHPGTYVGTGFIVDKNVTIVGTPYDPNLVIIDCAGEHPASGAQGITLTGYGQGSVVLNGVTVMNGHRGSFTYDDPIAAGVDGFPQEEFHEAEAGAIYAGGIVVRGNHTIVNCIIRDCSVTGNHGANGTAGGDPEDDDTVSKNGGRGGWGGDAGGGGMYIEYGSPSIINCRFENCRATGGNAGYGAEGWLPPEANVPTGWSGSGGSGGDAYGGAIYIRMGSPFVKDCVFDGCTATAGDGGDGGEGSPGADANDGGVSGFAHGGGVYCPVGTNPTFINCVIKNCGSFGGNGGNGGDAHYDEDYGGGLGGWGGLANDPLSGQEDPRKFTAYGGGVYCSGRSGAMFTDCTFSDNTARGSASGLGGHDAPYLWQQQPRKHYNVQSYGAGIFCGDSSATMFTRCTIEGNEITQNQDDPNDPDDPNDDILYYNREYTGFGGGMCLWGTYISLITDCNITENFAPVGGGVYGYASGLRIEDSNLVSNVSYAGGGVLANNSSAIISGCEFRDNTAATYRDDEPNQTEGIAFGSGGGFYCMSSYVEVSDCNISENSALLSGGGVYFDGDVESLNGPVLKNCLVARNSAGRSGAGISSVWYAKPRISNCTIADNRLRRLLSYGGGLYSSFGSDTAVIDSILWGNFGVNGSQIALEDDLRYPLRSTVDISYSNVEEPNEVPALDLVFCIDTTGSMTGDIAAVQEAATAITNLMAEIFSDFRIGIVEYHDYPDDVNTNPADFYDFIYNDVVAFTDNVADVLAGIDTLVAGGGNASGPEAVYSGLMHCIDADTLYVTLDAVDPASQGGWPNAESPGPGDWRIGADVKRVIVLMGDTPPKDPESYTNYTLEDIAAAAQAKLINIFSIVTAGYPSQTASAVEHFTALAEETAGATTLARDADEAVEAIMAVIHSLVAGGGIYFEGDCNVFGWEPNDPNYPWDPNDPDGPWDPGKHNINVDPNFVADYYLSWILAGQKIDSPCVDAGSAAAADVGLDTHTTRIDGVTDTGILDLGYHHREGLAKYQLTVTVREDPNAPGVFHGVIDPNGGWYCDGTVLVLVPRPEPGYHLRGWYDVNDVLVSKGGTLEVVMDSNQTFIAEFGQPFNIKVPFTKPTIEEAMEIAANGDRIIVSRGVHRVSDADGIDFEGKMVTLMSEKPNDPNCVAQTIIDCQGSRYAPRRAFHFHSREDPNTIVTGFTIRNGYQRGSAGAPGRYVALTPSPYESIDLEDANGVPRAERGQDSPASDGYGGAILCDGASPTIKKCVITNCIVAGGQGGDGAQGLWGPWSYIPPDPNAGLQDVDDGQWGGHGGDGLGNGYGGAIACLNWSNPVITDCIIEDNIARGGCGGEGGDGGNATEFPDFDQGLESGAGSGGTGYGDGFGGAIYCENRSTPVITNCIFENNIARQGLGGAPGDKGRGNESDEDPPPPLDGFEGGSLASSAPTGRIAGGAAYYGSGCDPNFTNCEFRKNSSGAIGQMRYLDGYITGGWGLYRDAYTRGGGLYSGLNNTIVLNSCDFTDNLGGAVHCDPNCDLDIDNCLFQGNSVTTDGGAIRLSYDSYIDANDSSFMGNLASGDGGALNSESDVRFVKCTFGGNKSGGTGGAISAHYDASDPKIDSTVSLEAISCIFAGNEVVDSNIGVFDSNDIVIIDGSVQVIDSNVFDSDGMFVQSGVGWGGGIFARDFEAAFTDCYFTDNVAKSGGGLLLIDGTVSIDRGLIYANKAIGGDSLELGGGVGLSNTKATIENCTIRDNSAEGDNGSGGGIGLYGGGEAITHLIKNCLMTGNTATLEGGGISCNIYTEPKIQNCTFSGNSADSFGGAVSCDWTSSARILYSIFERCNSYAICEEDIGGSSVKFSLFYDNVAGDYAVYDSSTGQADVYDGTDLAPNNIGGNPWFVAGPFSRYYLDQSRSPAVDGGDVDANVVGMNIFTTDPAGNLDLGRVDIGYHHPDPLSVGQYKLTVSVIAGHGTIEPNEPEPIDYDPAFDTYTYYAGTVVTVSAYPDAGYRIRSWSGTINDASKSFDNMVIMLEDTDVTVEFDQPRTIYVGQDPNYTTIQHAIDDAVDGDTVVVPSGTYDAAWWKPDIHIINKGITLTGTNPDYPTGGAATVLKDYMVSIFNNRGKRVVINGLTFKGGRMDIQYASPILRNCIFTESRWKGLDAAIPSLEYDGKACTDGSNGVSVFGGAIEVYSSSPDFGNCVFTDCWVRGGNGGKGGDCDPYGKDGGWGGKAYGGAVYIDPTSNATFTDCTFTRCYARGGDGGDGGDGEFHGGRGGSWEWAPSIETGPGTPGWGWWDGWSWGPYDKDGNFRYTYEGAYGFYDDYWRYSGYGGAVHSRSKGLVKFIGCIFTDNHSIGGISGMGGEPWRHPDRKLNIENFGGAVYATGGDIEFIGCTLSECSADTSVVEAPDDVMVSYGGALAFEDLRSVRLENCNVGDNRAAIGGGVYWSKTDATIVDCTITGSTAYHGGGLYSAESTGSITGSMIAENEAVNIAIPSFDDPNGPYEPNDPNRVVEPFDSGVILGEGGGYCCLSSIVDINDSVFDENRASASGGGIYFGGSDLDNYFEPTVTNCLITNNTARRDGGGISSNLYAGPVISNCTIAENTVSDPNGYGGGLYCSYNSTAELINSIIYGNRGGSGAQLAVGSEDKPSPLPSLVKITYSDVGPAYNPDEVAVAGFVEPLGDSERDGDTVLIDGETIYGQLETGEGTAKVIVSLVEPAELRAATDWTSSASVDQLRAEAASRQLSVLRGLGPDDFTLRYRFENQAGFSGEVTASGLNKLLNNSLVAHIEPVRYVQSLLAQAIPLGNASAAQRVYGGTGAAVAIVDSGVDYTHPMLGDDDFPNDKVIGGYDMGNNDADPMPVAEAHGTCCAGIAAGNLGAVGDYIGGVAPDAKIYALKMTTDEGLWPSDSAVASWDWCVTHWNDDPNNPIKVMSNSWALWTVPFDDPFVADAYSPALTTAADNTTAVGITILAGSGNDGFAGDGVTWPAAMSKVISVGAVFDTSDQVTGYSDTAENLDILAPADPVYTTDIAGPGGYTAGDYYPYFNGTSSACPFAAGAVASLQSAALDKTGNYLTPAQVKHLLVTTGDPVTDTKVDITKPRVNLGLAIAGIVYGAPVHVEDGCRLNEIVAYDWDPTAFSWSADSNNIDYDPWFVADYYLSHIDAGQDVDSQCIDAGSDVSGEFFTGWYATRTDQGLDKGVVDLGYHHRFGQGQPCRFADLVYDGVVDFADLAFFSSNWRREGCSVDNDYCDGTDLNFDGYVDFKDFAFFADCQLVKDELGPIPNPSEWEIEPYLLATEPVYKASMTAKIAIDGWGFAVEYRFERTDSDGKPNGTFRDWDPSRTYVDETLSGGKTGYRVKTRDVLGNETEWSVIRYVMTEDKVPPEPDPLTWVVVPYATSESSIRMEADTAFDTSGVEYYFDCVTPDGHDSGWQSSPVYEDVGLASNTTYTYRVRARDRSLNQNQTAWSVEASATTLESTVPDPMTWAVVPIATGTASIYMAATEADDVGQVEYYFECTDGGGHDSGWQAGASYEDTGLEADKTYTYRVRARKAQPEKVTGWSTALSATTLAVPDVTTPTPDPSQWAEGGEPLEIGMDWTCSATMTAETADAPGGVEYFFECFDDHRFDSGWQTEPTYTVLIGACGQGKRFRVKTHDLATKQRETGWSPLWPAW